MACKFDIPSTAPLLMELYFLEKFYVKISSKAASELFQGNMFRQLFSWLIFWIRIYCQSSHRRKLIINWYLFSFDSTIQCAIAQYFDIKYNSFHSAHVKRKYQYVYKSAMFIVPSCLHVNRKFVEKRQNKNVKIKDSTILNDVKLGTSLLNFLTLSRINRAIVFFIFM